MTSRACFRSVAALLLLCGVARPAFADDIPIPSPGQLVTLLIVALGLVGLVVWLFVLLFKYLLRNQNAKRSRPTVPTARIKDDARK
jgi:hypothetical protein